MKEEIYAAVSFIIKLIRQNCKLSEEDLLIFAKNLSEQLYKKFVNHWHPEKPWQGQGYRCLRLNEMNGKEPTIAKAALDSGFNYSDLRLPLELTIWVDPEEVCCRFGEHKGSYCTIASFHDGTSEDFIDRIDISQLVSKEEKFSELHCVVKRSSHKHEADRSESECSSKANMNTSSDITKSSLNPQIGSPSNSYLSSKISPPIFYSQRIPGQQVFLDNSNELSHTRNNSWNIDGSEIWPTFVSNPYFQVSSQEHLSANRYSPPISGSKQRLSSGSVLDTGGLAISQRAGWFYSSQLAAV